MGERRAGLFACAVALVACDGGVSRGTPSASGASSGDAGSTSGGGGVGGAFLCTPGAVESCYTGPAGTEGVGPCTAGTRTCLPDGSAFGPCEGEITPEQEDCATAEDDNCDGVGPVVCPGPLECGNVFGSPHFEDAVRLATNEDGLVAISGRFFEPIDFGGAPVAPA